VNVIFTPVVRFLGAVDRNAEVFILNFYINILFFDAGKFGFNELFAFLILDVDFEGVPHQTTAGKQPIAKKVIKHVVEIFKTCAGTRQCRVPSAVERY
jgi:hypothetical protein